ncbi:MAG TPA: hypothetical protein VIV11_09510 [Kofleriaceae bacterium]
MVGRLLLMAATLAGCRATGTFVCEADEHCRLGMDTGRCEPMGYCSFPDHMCPSGYRYDDSAGPDYAGRCVGEATPVDAAIDVPIDAPPFNVASCPTGFGGYNVTIASSTSRYRLIVAQRSWWVHAADCDADLPGATHLVIPDSGQEIIELSQYIDPIANTGSFFFVGAVQSSAAAVPTMGWIRIDDGPVPAEVWAQAEPDDDDGIENSMTQLGFFDKSASVRRMSDGSGLVTRGAVCECDGKTYGTTARAYIDADPNNPN